MLCAVALTFGLLWLALIVVGIFSTKVNRD